jgi:hypothetical protein
MRGYSLGLRPAFDPRPIRGAPVNAVKKGFIFDVDQYDDVNAVKHAELQGIEDENWHKG